MIPFAEFYSRLYTSPSDDTQFFFQGLDIPKITIEHSKRLEAPLMLSEATHAINAMQNGKSPGLDGYLAEFCKKLAVKLRFLLLETFTGSVHRKAIPETLTQASISLILKKDKDPSSCSYYPQVSLLCLFVKILAKEFAKRLETFIPSYF